MKFRKKKLRKFLMKNSHLMFLRILIFQTNILHHLIVVQRNRFFQIMSRCLKKETQSILRMMYLVEHFIEEQQGNSSRIEMTSRIKKGWSLEKYLLTVKITNLLLWKILTFQQLKRIMAIMK